MRKILAILKYTILTLLALVVIVPATLYIPAVQNFACQKAVEYLNEQNKEMTFSVGKIRIGFPLHLKVYDVKASSTKDGTLLLGLGKLQTGLDDFSLDDNRYLIKDITLENLTIGLDSVSESFGVNGEIKKLKVRDLLLQLNESIVEIGKFVVESPDLDVVVKSSTEKDSIEESIPFDWKIAIDKALLLDGEFDITALEKNTSLTIKSLQTTFKMEGDEIVAEDIDLLLPDSYISGNFSTNLSILDSVGNDGYIKTQLHGEMASQELTTLAGEFLPELKDNWPKEDTRLSVDVFLTKDTLNLQDLSLKIDNHTDFKIEASGEKLFDNEKRKLRAKIKGDLQDADFLLTTFIDKPDNRIYHLPKRLFAEIEVKQRKNYAECEFIVKQNKTVVAEGSGVYDLGTEKYSLNAKTDRLRLTDFVPMTGIDGLSTHIEATGQHFDFPGKKTSFDIRCQLDTLLYNNGKSERDSLFDISINATLSQSHYFVQISSGHPYIMLDTQLEGDYAKENISAQGYIDLQRLDLMHMPQIVATDLGEIAMQSDVMASYDYGDNAFADIFIHTFTYDDGERVNPFDNIDIRLNSEPGRMNATFESGDARLYVDADKSISQITNQIDSLMTEVTKQVDSVSLDLPTMQQLLPHINADFSMARNNSFYPLIQLFGYRFHSVNAKIRNDETLSIAANAYGLYLNETTRIDTIQFKLRPEQNNDVYNYNIFANYLAPKAKDSYEIKAHGEIMKDSLTTCVKYENGKYITVYDMDAALALSYDTIRLHFTEDPVIYAQHFEVNKDNYIQVSQFKDLAAQALDISANLDLDNDTGLCVNLTTNRKDSVAGQDVKLRVENLDLNYLAKTLDMAIDMGGKLNSEFYIELLPTSLRSNVATEISTFHIGDYKADTLLFDGLAMHEAGETNVAGKLTIDKLVKLDMLANLCDSVDLSLGIRDFPLPLVNSFLPTNMQLRGEATGDITVKGKDFEKPSVEGKIAMHKATANYIDCDALIHFPEDTIRIRRNNLRFRNYALTAANNNPILLNGSVSFREALDNPQLDLTLRGEKTQIFDNTSRKSKQQYICGTLPASVDMTIKGKLSNLDVKGTVSALEGTNLIYYLEEAPLSSASKVDELVDFVRFREIDRILPDRIDMPYRVGTKDEGVEVALKLNIANNAKIYVHLPTNEQDHVTLLGGASLQLTCEKDGSMVMSGMYDISGGDVHYKLPMIPMTKDFALSDRSWISWNGDIADPNINLIAIENVRSTVNDNAGSRVVSFDVTINIAGTLNQLDISFTCDAPEDGTIASEIASLTDEERSKQALLLLIAQTYMGPGNSASMGLASANAALNSVLNKELESLLSNKMKNTDINVGIDTYDADGAVRTDYSVKVSQRLFNDRMRVTVGGKISSNDSEQEGNSDAMINDVSLEYLTNEDGTSYIRLFRKTNYQNILEGEVVESGIGYVQQRSGFKFKNLFSGNKKREAAIREQIKAMQEAERQAEREQQRRRNNNNRNDRKERTDTLTTDSLHINPVAADSLQFNK